MTPKLIRRRFRSAVDLVVSKIEEHVVRPGRDFIRHYKLPADDLITFLVAEGSSSTDLLFITRAHRNWLLFILHIHSLTILRSMSLS